MNAFRFVKPSRPVSKVFIHCSASDNPAHDNVATMREWHLQRGWSDVGYHIFLRKSGKVEIGRSLEKTPAAQAGHNRGSIAICLHGLKKNRFTTAQKKALVALCVQINEAYGGAVTFHGHREVAAKECPVIDYKSLLKLSGNGRLGVGRADIDLKQADIGSLAELEKPETAPAGQPVLHFNDKGPAVEWLQDELNALGYHVGVVDGHFGGRTRGAVLAFQADNFLIEDGIVGNATYEALAAAAARPVGKERSKAGVFTLAGKGSRIAQASVAQGFMGTALTGGGVLSVIEQSSGTVTRITNSFGTFGDTLKLLGPWIGALVVVGGIYIVLQAVKAGKARAEDHRTGKTS